MPPSCLFSLLLLFVVTIVVAFSDTCHGKEYCLGRCDDAQTSSSSSSSLPFSSSFLEKANGWSANRVVVDSRRIYRTWCLRARSFAREASRESLS